MSDKTVRAQIGYSERTGRQPYFYANAHEKDFVPLKPVEVEIRDARGLDTSLDVEGFTLVEHSSAVVDLTDLAAVGEKHAPECAELLKAVTGCDHVSLPPMGILRFSERSGANAAHDNSHPARFVHVDMARGPRPKASRLPAARNTTSGACFPTRRRTCRWACATIPRSTKAT
jgi:hypothetical protein